MCRTFKYHCPGFIALADLHVRNHPRQIIERQILYSAANTCWQAGHLAFGLGAPIVLATLNQTYTASTSGIPLIANAAAGLYQTSIYVYASPTYGGAGANCSFRINTNNGVYPLSPGTGAIVLTGPADTVGITYTYVGAGQSITGQVTITAATPTGNCNVAVAISRLF